MVWIPMLIHPTVDTDPHPLSSSTNCGERERDSSAHIYQYKAKSPARYGARYCILLLLINSFSNYRQYRGTVQIKTSQLIFYDILLLYNLVVFDLIKISWFRLNLWLFTFWLREYIIILKWGNPRMFLLFCYFHFCYEVFSYYKIL